MEFLNIKLQEQEKQLSAQDESIRILQAEKRELETVCKQKVEQIVTEKRTEIELMNIQVAKYKTGSFHLE